MTSTLPSTGLELRSIITGTGELELSLVNAPMPTPKADEVVVRLEAAPINPSDLGLLLGPADLSTAVASVQDGLPLVKAQIPQGLMKAMASRLDQSMAVGNEGAGVVVAAGDSREAQALNGKTVAVIGGAMYSQYRCVRAKDCLVLPADATSGHLSRIQRRCFSRGGARRCFTGLQSGTTAPVRADVAFRASAFSPRPRGRKISSSCSYRLGCRNYRTNNGVQPPRQPPLRRPPPRHSRSHRDNRSHRDVHSRRGIRRDNRRGSDDRRDIRRDNRPCRTALK